MRRVGVTLATTLACLAASPIEAATIRGTQHNDTITGTKQADTIYGLAGYDRINGAGGNDTIYGGPTNDRIRGGLGNDRMYGEAGDDAIFTDFGADYVDGGLGNDAIEAYGSPTWRPGMAWGQAGGASTVLGGPGNDRIDVIGRGIDAYGGDGDDRVEFVNAPDETREPVPFGAVRWTGGPGRDSIEMLIENTPNAPAMFVSIMDFRQGEDSIYIRGVERFATLAELIALLDVNHDGHLSAAGDGLQVVNGNCQATFKTNSSGKIVGLELKVLGQNQVWLQGIADLGP